MMEVGSVSSMRKNTGLLLAGALAVALAVTGCSANEPEPVPTATTEPAPTVTAEPEPAPVDVDAGDQVPQELVKQLHKGTKAFEVEGGDLIAVVADEPLPEPVRAAVQAEANSRVERDVNDGSGQARSAVTSQGAASSLSMRTGKHIVLIVPARATCGCTPL